jgi:predicted  nucleic acid-binding Zn-ribbon protein
MEEMKALNDEVKHLRNENVDLKIRVRVLETDVKSIKEDITSIKDDTKWLRRTITGAFITAGAVVIIGLIMYGLKGGFIQ